MADFLKCPRCGREMPANFAPGTCPACLLQQGLSPSTMHGSQEKAPSSVRSSRRPGWTPPTPEELAPRFPQLEIAELLGCGGMGAVYKVRQKELDRWAALKVLPDEVAHDPNFAERFQREARALALLTHQNIVIVYEFGQRDGFFFLLMEFIDGVTLRQAIRAGQISAKEALGIVAQICDALQFAHEEGVVHRDIKPENILIDKRGRVKIADFGLAKLLGRSIEVLTLTGTNQVMGTPVYMAPEQFEGTKGVDHRADIFSLGVVFYELLTGELPLGRFDPPSQKYSLDVRLDDVVLRTLEKEPNRRYQQASDVKCDVESIRSQPIVATEKKLKNQSPRWGLKQIFLSLSTLVGGTLILFSVAMLTVIGLLSVGTYVTVWPRPQIPVQSNSQNQAALIQYEKTLERYRADQDAAKQKELEEQKAKQLTGVDPMEANAIVQFAADGVNLRPDFGVEELNDEHRKILQQILTDIHRAYLEIEARYTQWKTENNGSQVALIGCAADADPKESSEKFNDEVSKLENRLWTEIDSKLPVLQQKFLRHLLPIYASDSASAIPMMLNPAFGAAISMSGGSSMMSSMGASAALVPGHAFGQGGSQASPAGINLRFPQLLGWRIPGQWDEEPGGRGHFGLPIRVTIRQKGKWYLWMIEQNKNGFVGSTHYDPEQGTNVLSYKPDFSVSDRGESPVLPTGIRRFFREASPNSSEIAGNHRSIDGLLSPELSENEFHELKQPTENRFEVESFTSKVLDSRQQNLADSKNQGTSKKDSTTTSALNQSSYPDAHMVPTVDGLQLDSNWTTELSSEHRDIANRIIAKIHKKYVEFEFQRISHSTRKHDGSQVTIIRETCLSPATSESGASLDDYAEKLEDEFWNEIDAALPVAQQEYLRKKVELTNRMASTFGLEEGVLGFYRCILPARITIRRQGKWFRWSIEALQTKASIGMTESALTTNPFVDLSHFNDFIQLASGYGPSLPRGLARYWKENLSDETAPDVKPAVEVIDAIKPENVIP